jgi:thiol-disulfide isomerase/thioredoxin
MVSLRFVATFSITALTFLIGIFLGQAVSDYRLSEAQQSQNDLMSSLIGYELAYTLISEHDLCSTDFTELQIERAKLGRKVSELGERLGQNDSTLRYQTELYHTYQLREYSFLKKVKQDCNKTYPLVLYFYSNNNDLCVAQGQTLDAIQAKYNLTTIYAINYEIDNPSVNIIKKIYNVTSTPTLVINENKYEGFIRFEKIEEILYRNTTSKN